MQVDKIIYNAIQADADLMTTIGSRVVSTCYEVPPTEEDNTPLPFIIVTDDGFQASPNEVKDIIKQVRKAVEQYVGTMYQQGEEIPQLDSLSSDGLAWDWMKPCYYQRLTYQVTTLSNIDDGQEI